MSPSSVILKCHPQEALWWGLRPPRGNIPGRRAVLSGDCVDKECVLDPTDTGNMVGREEVWPVRTEQEEETKGGPVKRQG